MTLEEQAAATVAARKLENERYAYITKYADGTYTAQVYVNGYLYSISEGRFDSRIDVLEWAKEVLAAGTAVEEERVEL